MCISINSTKKDKRMARRQPYEHLNKPVSANASSDLELSPTEDGGIEIVIDDDGFSPVEELPVHEEHQEQAATDPVPESETKIERQTETRSADDEAYVRLKAQLDREKLDRQRIEARLGEEQLGRTAAEKRASEAEQESFSAQEIAIENALQSALRDASHAEDEHVRLLENAEYKEAAKALRIMIEAENRVVRLREGKEAIEAQKNRKPEPPVQRQAEPQRDSQREPETDDDRYEAYIDQPVHSAEVKNYLRSHYNDIFKSGKAEAMTSRLIAAHHLAMADGIRPNTEAYFKFWDKQMGYDKSAVPLTPNALSANGGAVSQPEPEVQQFQPVRQPQKPPPPPAAPVSRDSSPSNGGRQVLRLTAAQVQFCKEAGIDPKSYAMEVKNISSGAYPNISWMS